jgi:hypothetical protein
VARRHGNGRNGGNGVRPIEEGKRPARKTALKAIKVSGRVSTEMDDSDSLASKSSRNNEDNFIFKLQTIQRSHGALRG